MMDVLRSGIPVRREDESDGSVATAKDSALMVKELWIVATIRDRGPRPVAGHPQNGVTYAAASSLLMAALVAHCLPCSIGFYTFFCK